MFFRTPFRKCQCFLFFVTWFLMSDFDEHFYVCNSKDGEKCETILSAGVSYFILNKPETIALQTYFFHETKFSPHLCYQLVASHLSTQLHLYVFLFLLKSK